MRYLLFLVVLTSLAFSAKVNEALYSETNATAEIHKIRKIVSNNLSTDAEEQNQISIQKLFLSKLETLANTSSTNTIEHYAFPKDNKLTQKQFFEYFDHVSNNISKMLKRKDNEIILLERMASLKEQLSDLAPNESNAILQAQLQYAYFKWKDIFNKEKIKDYEAYLENEKKRFVHAFEIADINMEQIDKKLDKLNAQVQVLHQKKVYLELRVEKETIIIAGKKKEDINADLNHTVVLTELSDKDANWRYNFLLDELKQINKKISETIVQRNQRLILKQIYNLQKEDLDKYIQVRHIMKNSLNDLNGIAKKQLELELKMLEWLKYQNIGSFTSFLFDSKAWMNKVYSDFEKFVTSPLFYLRDKPVDLVDVFKMFFTIILGFIFAKFYKNRVKAAQKRISFIQEQSFKIIGNMGYYLIVVIFIAIALHNIGLDLSSLSLVAGALSVGIGFGLKEVVGNFVSGLILMAERSARIGDFVEIDNVIVGNITDIRMRSVTIKTSSNVDIVVPNSDLVQKSFVNYTLEEPIRRLSVPFTVAYGVSYEKVNEVIMKALEESDLNYVPSSKKYETEVIMTGMDERGVNYTLFVFVRTYGPNARSSYFRLIYKALNDNGLPIPSPSLDVHMTNNQD